MKLKNLRKISSAYMHSNNVKHEKRMKYLRAIDKLWDEEEKMYQRFEASLKEAMEHAMDEQPIVERTKITINLQRAE